MNVYITYEKDGYGGVQVEKVFAKKQAAIDYIKETKFSKSKAYPGDEKRALIYIERHIVIDEE